MNIRFFGSEYIGLAAAAGFADSAHRVTGVVADSGKDGIGSNHRVARLILNPGLDFGGSCFPKDLRALLNTARETGQPFRSLEATVEANHHQRRVLPRKVRSYFGANAGATAPLRGKHFALWGLACKTHTADICDAIALDRIDNLTGQGAVIAFHNFEVITQVKAKPSPKFFYCEPPSAACKDANALLKPRYGPYLGIPDWKRLPAMSWKVKRCKASVGIIPTLEDRPYRLPQKIPRYPMASAYSWLGLPFLNALDPPFDP